MPLGRKEWEIKRFPTVVIPWTDVKNSTIIEDLRSWQTNLAYEFEIYGNCVELSKNTLKLILESFQCVEYGIKTVDNLCNSLWGKVNIKYNEDINGKVIMSIINYELPSWYCDLEATVY